MPTPGDVLTEPTVTADAAVGAARAAAPSGAAAEVEETVLVVYAPGDVPARLALRIVLGAGLADRWQVVIDAGDGALLARIDLVASDDVIGANADLFGVSRTLHVWREGGTHFLVDTSKAMFDGSSDPPSPATTRGGILILDARNQESDASGNVSLSQITSPTPTGFSPRDGVSAAFALGRTYDYYLEKHQRNSIDGSGGSMLGVVRFSQNFRNAFWNGSMMVFGDAQPYAGALDVVAHELTHGVTQLSANLVYQNQSGALNEAMSDVFGETAEAYIKGTASPDWLLGNDLGTPLRSMRNPHELTVGGRPYPARLSELIQPDDPFLDNFRNRDNGGVHINSSIINFAYYQLAEGLPGALGTDSAARIFYRALTTYLVANSQFVDARLACVRAAEDLFGPPSAEAQRTRQAFDSVEIGDGDGTVPPPPFPGTSGSDSLLFLGSLSGTTVAGRFEPGLGDPAGGVALSLTPAAARRPAVTGDGTVAVFVRSDFAACVVPTDGSSEANCIESSAGQVHSIAVSPDGRKIGLVLRDPGTGDPADQIDVLDTQSSQVQAFPLRAPELDGGGLSTVLNADVMDFTADDRFLVYDALNQIALDDGSSAFTFSLFALDITEDATFVIVPPNPAMDVGNPAFSQTSDNFITFDVVQGGDSTVVAADLTTGVTHDVAQVSGNVGMPGYNGDDSAIVLTVPSAGATSGGALVAIPLTGDRLTPSAGPTSILDDGFFGVVYRRGTFQGPAACAADGCSDGDPCTDDVCDPARGCSHAVKTGVPRVTCFFDYPTLDGPCAAEGGFAGVSAKLQRALGTFVKAEATHKAGKARALLRKGGAMAVKANRLATRLARKRRLGDACRSAVDTFVQEVRARAAAAR
ncbi:MAG: M4 family metallopeptidase [Candidatus Binatia bacterium]